VYLNNYLLLIGGKQELDFTQAIAIYSIIIPNNGKYPAKIKPQADRCSSIEKVVGCLPYKL